MGQFERNRLDKRRITETIEKLEQRIAERFPEAGLREVCTGLLLVSRQIDDDLRYIARPNWWLRTTVILFLLLVAGGLIFGVLNTELAGKHLNMVDFIQIAEAGLNDVVLMGAAVIFLISFENRNKRGRVIHAVNGLRSIAHVIDMHQLTKDPSVVSGGDTEHSPKRALSPEALGRYLDYCAEMLSLTSKVAICYIQNFDDPQAVAAVNELESLTTGLSRKVWQKIMLLRQDIQGRS